MPEQRERILVIKLSALGDLVLCFSAFSSIRKAHPNAEIALLTMPAFSAFAGQMPWFDRILIDERPRFFNLAAWARLIGAVRSFAPTRVYDFQGKVRQSILYASLGGPVGVEWSGAAPFCSHRRFWPPKPDMHYTDFVAEQLKSASVDIDPNPDTAWLASSIEKYSLPKSFALLVPGCAPQHLHKRWPAASYAELARKLAFHGLASVAIGTAHDAQAVNDIRDVAPDVIDLTGRTSLKEVAELARQAQVVIGNDTGPTHLAAAVGAPTLALMSDRVKASWSSPRGAKSLYIEGKPLADLSVHSVYKAVREFLPKAQ